MTPRLLVPINALQAGKSRLSPVLRTDERRRLNEFFLRHIVQIAMEFPGAERTTIVSGCDDALPLAASLGVSAFREPPGCELNEAVRRGVDHLRSFGPEPILIVPSDLPLVRADDFREISSIEGGRRILVCPDKFGTGTNALYLPAGRSIEFRFGVGSCIEHMRQTGLDGISPLLYFNSRMAMDIDDPNDLHCWLAEQTSDASHGPLTSCAQQVLSDLIPNL